MWDLAKNPRTSPEKKVRPLFSIGEGRNRESGVSVEQGRAEVQKMKRMMMESARLKEKNDNKEDDGDKIRDDVKKVGWKVVGVGGWIIDESKEDMMMMMTKGTNNVILIGKNVENRIRNWVDSLTGVEQQYVISWLTIYCTYTNINLQ